MYPADGSYTSNSLPDVNSLNFIVTDLGAAGQSIICLEEDGEVLGGFALTGCKGYPEPLPYTSGSYLLYPRYLNTDLETEKHLLDPSKSGSELTERDYLLGADIQILRSTSRPGLFEITHPLQFTQNDFFLHLLRLLFGGGGEPSYLARGVQGRHRVPLPVGSLMPYFYGDFDRGYVIVPGLYPRPLYTREIPPGQPTGDRTYSDLSKFLDDVRMLLRTYLTLNEKDLADVLKKLTADPEFKRLLGYGVDLSNRRYGMRFENFYHPLVCALRVALDSGGVDRLMRRDVQLQQTAFEFATTFQPTGVVVGPYPVEDIDFTRAGAYSSYNWELFFHLPYEIASRLSNDQQFAAARDWLHYIFNPVGVIDPAASGPPAAAPAKYWITKPFFQRTPADYAVEVIDAISNRIALDPEALHIDDLVFAVDQWRDKPFSPFVVARSRTVAFQLATVKAYVQNLVDWADSEFLKLTHESVTTATELYLMAEKLLGVKPQVVPPEFEAPTETYNQLEASVDIFGNALVDVENLIPGWEPVAGQLDPWMPAPISATSLYFCIPQNEDLLALWDLLADRLFKIRHCQNIDGVETLLALFAPPIDPGALVRALASGGSLSSVLAGLGAPPPYYRFMVMTQGATELVGEVASLGNQMLSALEKRDGEALAQLRTTQEQTVLRCDQPLARGVAGSFPPIQLRLDQRCGAARAVHGSGRRRVEDGL